MASALIILVDALWQRAHPTLNYNEGLMCQCAWRARSQRPVGCPCAGALTRLPMKIMGSCADCARLFSLGVVGWAGVEGP